MTTVDFSGPLATTIADMDEDAILMVHTVHPTRCLHTSVLNGSVITYLRKPRLMDGCLTGTVVLGPFDRYRDDPDGRASGTWFLNTAHIIDFAVVG